MFPFFNCYQFPQLNCKFKRLAYSPQGMNLLAKIMPITPKSMSLNAGTEVLICKENGHVFRAHFQTKTYFKPARAVCVLKHLHRAKYFFSLSIQLKLR